MKRLIAVTFLLALAACSTTPQETEQSLVQNAKWQSRTLHAGSFDVEVAEPAKRSGQTLWVYLEGDGIAYITPTRAALDPSPPDPVGLRLALAHPGTGAVAYIARPCQYVQNDSCKKTYWTTGRYAPEIIASVNRAIDILKAQNQASHVVLVGYSGGGAVAILAAAERRDVAGIVTVASNLDLAYWTRENDFTPLTQSRDPADAAAAVARIPQLHFVGGKDDTVDPDVTRSFLRHMPADTGARMVLLPAYSHTCCWVENWDHLLKTTAPNQVPPFNAWDMPH